MSTNEPTAEQITPEQWAKAKRLAVELHFATGDYAVARCHELLSRAERAEREAREAKNRVSFLESELAKSGYRYADSTALTRNSAGGGLEHERGAGEVNGPAH